MAWNDNLQAASWRGIPFQVAATTLRRGRKTAVHEYAFRDVVWVEDLGRAKREISFTGFLIGDDVLDQQSAISDAAEKEGSGDLVHPALGLRTCSVTGFETSMRADLGRVAELTFTFIETKDPTYPSASQNTQSLLSSLTGPAGTDIASDFAAIKSGLAQGFAVVAQVANTVTRIANQVIGIIHDPLGSLLQLTGLSGVAALGRYAFVSVSTAIQAVSSAASAVAGLFGGGTGASAATLIAATAAARSVAVASCSTAVTAASGISAQNTDTCAAAIAAMIAALRASSPNGSEQLRSLGLLLASTQPTARVGLGGLGVAIYNADISTCNFIRRTICLEMANACAVYVPVSYDDAVSVRTTVCEAFDAEILIAGDAGEDRSFEALRVVRAAVSADLTARGASLARMTDVALKRSLPSAVVAYTLYQDASRADELVSEVNPIAPLFMPIKFRAKAR